jgi:hypothetical protein
MNREKMIVKKTNKTNKINKRMNKVETNTSSRFTDPISSFPGRPPTAKELEIMKQMLAAFRKHETASKV